MQHRHVYMSWPLSAIILVVAGLALLGTGIYFTLLRPSLLPEDVRYLNLPAAQLDIVRPQLDAWLTQVFRVMGGYVFATGILTVSLAVTSFRAHQWSAAIGAAVGGASSVGTMAIINFKLDSDFKWAILFMAFLWACSLGLFWFEMKSLGKG